MNDADQRVTVLTGASAGIGRIAARLFAERGDAVVLCARRADKLESLAGELRNLGSEVAVVPADLADASSAGRLIDAVLARFGRIDVLVNNAGYGMQEFAEKTPLDELEKMFRVNVLTLMDLCRLAIPVMKRQGGGSIVNVASVAGIIPQPLHTAYAASKAAVIGYSRSLRVELWGTGIRVCAVCPAQTRTEFFDVSTKGIPYPPILLKALAPPEAAARAVVRASESRRALIYPNITAWSVAVFGRLLPFVADLGGYIYRNMVTKNRGS